MHDLMIENAIIIDGTGGERFTGCVTVSGGTITEIHEGKARGENAKKRIDAEGRVLSPGFIDPHTHYDAQIAWDPLLTSSPWHGVTSVVQGNCGVGVAPLPPAMREIAIWDLVHVEDIPYETMISGIDWQWETFGEYLGAMQARGVGINVAGYVPLTPIRQTAMGEASLERAATDEEIERMKAVFRQSLCDGGFGWSATFFDGHVGYQGRPVACRLADRRELGALCQVMREEGLGTSAITFNQPELGSILDESLDLLNFVSEASGRPITYNMMINHHRDPKSYLKGANKLAHLMESGAVLPQFPVKPISQNFHLKGPQALGYCKTLHQVFDQPLSRQLELYKDPEFRTSVQRDLDNNEIADRFYERLRVLDGNLESTKTLAASGRSLAEIAKEQGKSGIDCWFDIAIEENLETQFSFQTAAFDEEGTRNLINDGRFMPGLSDGGAHVAVLNDTGYATHLLGRWVREKQVLRLEEAVRLLSSLPADHFGIARRGRIKQGNHADLVLFDPDTVMDQVPEYVNDMPASGRRLVTRATGIHSTIVNGEVLFVDGEHQGPLPGRMLRSNDT